MAKAKGPAPFTLYQVAKVLVSLCGEVLGQTDQWAALSHKLDLIHESVSEIRSLLMALTQNEQRAVNELSSAINSLADDLAGVLAAAQSATNDLKAQISTLIEQGDVDQNTISALRASVDSMETDVIGALTPLTQQVTALDSGLTNPPAQGGGPLTPTG